MSQPASEIPRYACHKKVRAFKIKSITGGTAETDGVVTIIPEDENIAPVEVGRDYVKKHDPEEGGYYVRYEDGYESFSPAAAFEAGYTRIEENFQCAHCAGVIQGDEAHFRTTYDADANHYHFRCWEDYCHGVRGTKPEQSS